MQATNGVASFSGLKITAAGPTRSPLPTRPNLGRPASTNPFTVTAATASKLVFTSTAAGNQAVGTSANVGPFVVAIEDQYNNLVTNAGSTVSLLLSSTSSGTTIFTPTSGGSSSAAVTIASGASSTSNFYYADTKAGSPRSRPRSRSTASS